MTNTNVYLPEPVKVLENLRETTENFRLVLDIPFKNEPGQFVQISLLGIGEAPISIASWNRDYLMLHIREVGTVTRALGRCKPGDTVFIRGPYGKGYPMKEAEGRNLVVIAGGCGVASVKGVFDYCGKNRDKYSEVYAFVGYRNSKEVIFEDFVEEWQEEHEPLRVAGHAQGRHLLRRQRGLRQRPGEDNRVARRATPSPCSAGRRS